MLSTERVPLTASVKRDRAHLGLGSRFGAICEDETSRCPPVLPIQLMHLVGRPAQTVDPQFDMSRVRSGSTLHS